MHPAKTTPDNLFDSGVTMAKVTVIHEGLDHIAQESKKDKTSTQIEDLMINGWPENKDNLSPDICPYFMFRQELPCVMVCS